MLRKLTFGVLLITGSGLAGAAEWEIKPELGLRAGYVDNLRLTTTDEVSTAEATFSPSAVFSVSTPTSGASGTLRFDFHRYEESSDLDENNSFFTIDTYHSFERSRMGLQLDYVNDTTLDSQLEETGLVFARIPRTRMTASPNWTWLLSERTSLRASYTYSDVVYKDAGGTGFVDYTLNNGGLTLSHKVSDRASASLTLSGTRSDNDNDVSSTNGSLQTGFSYMLSETLSTSLYIGVRHTQVDYSSTSLIPIYSGSTLIGFLPLTQDVSNSDWGGTFSAGITRKFLRGETGLSASQDISNSINGTPIEVDRIRWHNIYWLSEILAARLSIEYYRTQFSNTVGQDLDRDYYQIQPEFTWKFRRFWDLTGSYRYRKQTFANSNDDASQNAAYLTLSYHWPRIARSR